MLVFVFIDIQIFSLNLYRNSWKTITYIDISNNKDYYPPNS